MRQSVPAGSNGPKLKFKPKLDKIVELLLYLAHKHPNSDQYQAVKFMYLADREHFNKFGRPITFETYYALDYGPVATNALDLIKGKFYALKAAGISGLPIELERRDNIIILSHPLRAVDYDIFSRSDIHVFDDILKRYGDKSFDDLYRITHKHFAYDYAWKNRKQGNRALMYYEDMLDENPKKSIIINELELIAENMK
ncbi:DUF4065 domain-containing protein [Lichenibacterium minor]|uniref:DUF4065 domain-containing protein n=1 Tax=Lichenibacterium minor TaxID=2316528 RepID=A0A4V1RV97_9HYPH|nr:Panacea domain-containing protein [Lichenibacterium minor]RYC33894.1 DUF4065 domain-containing protein [Lichenibacterium minor]